MSISKAILISGVVGVIVVGLALGIAISFTPGATAGTSVLSHSLTVGGSYYGVTSYATYSSAGLECGFPPGLLNLAYAVQKTPGFANAENSVGNPVFRLAYGDNETGSVSMPNNPTSLIYEQETVLTYFSLVNSSVVPTCTPLYNQIKYVLFVSVPFTNGSYNMNALSAYAEFYEPNSTSVP